MDLLALRKLFKNKNKYQKSFKVFVIGDCEHVLDLLAC